MRRLLASVGISDVGDGIRQTALPLLAAALTADPLGVSAVAVAEALPWLLVTLLAGALVDRWDRRTVVLAANTFRAVLAGVLAATVALDLATIPALCLAAFSLTAAETFADAASQALLPALVGIDDLERANSRLSVVSNVAVQFVGPPLGGLLFALRPLPFATDAVSFAASALLLRNLPPLPSPPREKSSLRRDIGEGLRFLFARPVLRAMVIAVVLSNLLMGAVFGVFVLYSLNVLHLHPAEYGLLFTAFAAGAVVGSLFAGRLRSLLGAGPAVITSMLLLGLPFLLMVLLPDAYVAGAAMVLTGIGEGVWNVLNMSLRQAVTPDALRGRVLSTFRMFGLGSGSVGAALGGVLAAGFGVSFPILVAGIALPAASVLLLPALSTRAIEEARVP